MEKRRSIRIFLLIVVALSIFLSAAAPSPLRAQNAAAAERSSLVRLTVDNRTSSSISIRLGGPFIYYLRISAGEAEVFTVNRAVYTYTLYACGASSTSTLDMSSQKTLVMPVCGGNAKSADAKADVVDLSVKHKIVKVGFENDSSTRLLAILTGPQTYVFTFEPGEKKSFTIAKGSYRVQYFACGRVALRAFEAYKGKVLELACPAP